MAKVQFLSEETALLMLTVPKRYKMDIVFIKSPHNRFKGSKTLTHINFQLFTPITIDKSPKK